MLKQIILPLVLVAAFIVAVGIFVKRSGSTNVQQTSKSIVIGTKTIPVEIADNQELRARGLSGRTSLDAGTGMLFIFDSKGVKPGFWMKDMLIPLDFIWIADGKVVKIDKNVSFPSPGTPDNQLKVYYPNGLIDYVLEVNAGFSDKNNIQVGDSVDVSAAI